MSKTENVCRPYAQAQAWNVNGGLDCGFGGLGGRLHLFLCAKFESCAVGGKLSLWPLPLPLKLKLERRGIF